MTSPTAVLLGVLSTVALGSPPDSLALSLSSDKSVYSKGESVKLTIVLENLSLRDLTVNKRMAHPGPDLMIEIMDSMGNKLRWFAPNPPPIVARDDFTVLKPGQKLVVPISDLENGLFDKFKGETEYSVKVRYQNSESGAKFNYAAWTGSLLSNTITFQWKG